MSTMSFTILDVLAHGALLSIKCSFQIVAGSRPVYATYQKMGRHHVIDSIREYCVVFRTGVAHNLQSAC